MWATVLSCLALAGLSSTSASAADQRASAVVAAVSELQEQYSLRSVVFGVWAGGKELVSGALGNAYPGVRANRRMHFRIGNTAESFTSTLLLQLVEEGKIRLDDRSLKTVVDGLSRLDDSLARALCWGAAWDMTRDAEMRAGDFVALVLGNIATETDAFGSSRIPGYAAQAVHNFSAPEKRAELLATWERGLRDLLFAAEPTDTELKASLSYLADQAATFRKANPKADPERQALASLCQVLLGSNRFLYVD